MAKKAMRKIKVYPSYRYSGKDPILDKLLNIMDDSGLTKREASRISGVSTSTFYNWRKPVKEGGTRSPQFCTVNAAARGCGHELVFRSMVLTNGK